MPNISKAQEMALWNKFYSSLPTESYLHDYFVHMDEILYRAMLDDTSLDVARLVWLGMGAKENVEEAQKNQRAAQERLLMEQQQILLKDRQLHDLNGELEAVKRDLDYFRQCSVKDREEFDQFKNTVRQALNTPEIREAVS